MQMIIGIIMGFMIPMAAFIGFCVGVKLTAKNAAERFTKYKAEIKMILRETCSLDTEPDKAAVWERIEEIKY